MATIVKASIQDRTLSDLYTESSWENQYLFLDRKMVQITPKLLLQYGDKVVGMVGHDRWGSPVYILKEG